MTDERKCGECGKDWQDVKGGFRWFCNKCLQWYPLCFDCGSAHCATCRVNAAEVVRVAKKQQDNLVKINTIGHRPVGDPEMGAAMKEMIDLLFEQRAALGIDGISPDTWRHNRASKDRIN